MKASHGSNRPSRLDIIRIYGVANLDALSVNRYY